MVRARFDAVKKFCEENVDNDPSLISILGVFWLVGASSLVVSCWYAASISTNISRGLSQANQTTWILGGLVMDRKQSNLKHRPECLPVLSWPSRKDKYENEAAYWYDFKVTGKRTKTDVEGLQGSPYTSSSSTVMGLVT
jgi:hypothetical protein